MPLDSPGSRLDALRQRRRAQMFEMKGDVARGLDSLQSGLQAPAGRPSSKSSSVASGSKFRLGPATDTKGAEAFAKARAIEQGQAQQQPLPGPTPEQYAYEAIDDLGLSEGVTPPSIPGVPDAEPYVPEKPPQSKSSEELRRDHIRETQERMVSIHNIPSDVAYSIAVDAYDVRQRLEEDIQRKDEKHKSDTANKVASTAEKQINAIKKEAEFNRIVEGMDERSTQRKIVVGFRKIFAPTFAKDHLSEIRKSTKLPELTNEEAAEMITDAGLLHLEDTGKDISRMTPESLEAKLRAGAMRLTKTRTAKKAAKRFAWRKAVPQSTQDAVSGAQSGAAVMRIADKVSTSDADWGFFVNLWDKHGYKFFDLSLGSEERLGHKSQLGIEINRYMKQMGGKALTQGELERFLSTIGSDELTKDALSVKLRLWARGAMERGAISVQSAAGESKTWNEATRAQTIEIAEASFGRYLPEYFDVKTWKAKARHRTPPTEASTAEKVDQAIMDAGLSWED